MSEIWTKRFTDNVPPCKLYIYSTRTILQLADWWKGTEEAAGGNRSPCLLQICRMSEHIWNPRGDILWGFLNKGYYRDIQGFPVGSDGKQPACSAGDLGSIPGLGRSGGGHGNPLQYSCLEKPQRQRSLAGYSSWSHKESDTTECLSTAWHRDIPK